MVKGNLTHRPGAGDGQTGSWWARWDRISPDPGLTNTDMQQRRWDVPVAESAVAPPGPIPNPVVTRCSAGEYCGGDPVGGEAAAGTSQRRAACAPGPGDPVWRGVEQWQLVGLITQRSEVRILPPLPFMTR
jgi:hypothetical protein